MTRRPADQRSDLDAPPTHDHVDVELEWAVGALRLPVADRWRRGVTVVLHPQTRRIGALLRAGDLHKGTLLEALERDDDEREMEP